MAHWTVAEGRLEDGKAIRLFLASHERKLWSACVHDDVHAITADEFLWTLSRANTGVRWQGGRDAVLEQAQAEVEEYFARKREQFTVPLKLRGTAFQQRVWASLQAIPYGSTQSYGAIAQAIGNDRACRAVGTANRVNNIGLFIPCHRVIAAGGKLGGYAGGLGIKKRLLRHEGLEIG